MKEYAYFTGIDTGKYDVVIAIDAENVIHTYPNTEEGTADCLHVHTSSFGQGFVVLETTGGYENLLLATLHAQQVAVHRANTRHHVKHFIRSYGKTATMDALDVKALARYTRERYASLTPYSPVSETSQHLAE